MTWILGSSVKDLGVFYVAPFALVLTGVFAPNWLWGPALGFLVYQWLDVGHAFPTIFRVAPKWGSRPVFTWALPLLVFVFLVAGFLLSPRWTLVAVVYLTAFHHIRQFYGVSRWYQYLNGRLDSWSGRWLYALTLLPLLLVHFREDLKSSQFAWAQLPHFENASAETILKLALAAAWAGWGLFELARLRRYGPELNRTLSVLLPALLHYWCFLKAPTIEAMLFPLLTIHALTYFFVVDRKSGKGAWNLPLLFAAGLIGGASVLAMEEFGEGRPAILALALTPTIWHYVIDGFIWRKSDLL
jgi:hypothetical protein